LLFVLLLVLAQTLLAAHEVGHLVDHSEYTCDICILGGGLDHATIDGTPRCQIVNPAATAQAPLVIGFTPLRAVPFRQRAPPPRPPRIT
jgi:hypothetical protein